MIATPTRREGRYPVTMTLTSETGKARVLDLSHGGARLLLAQKPADGAIAVADQDSDFQGLARVAWIRETLDGVEAGVQWQQLTAAALSYLKAAVAKAAL